MDLAGSIDTYREAIAKRVVESYQPLYPTPSQTERGMAYGGRPLWSRSPRSSPRRGKPGTWRRRTGGFDGIQQRGMQNARRRNCIERHTRTRRTRIAAGEHLSAAPGVVMASTVSSGSAAPMNGSRRRGYCTMGISMYRARVAICVGCSCCF